ncbi:MAG TPA: phospholipase D-like domain-containing protein [Candidatus Binatia bacterium]|nr:phospholipase D-like domain-containing protein [Candidatus Binatia bacterium]
MSISFDFVKAAILVHGEDLASYPHVLRVEPGVAFSEGRITGEPAVVIKVDRKVPLETLRARDVLPVRLGKVRVDVRQATVREQLALLSQRRPEANAITPSFAVERMASGLGVVDLRTPIERESSAVIEAEQVPYVPPPFSLVPVNADMTVVCHASPDSGWSELKAFLTAPAEKMSATIFEFNAKYIRDALLQAAGTEGKMDFVMHYKNLSGFDNKEAQQDLREELGDRLDFAWAAVAQTSAVTEGWFPSAYHIKTIVKDHRHLWISSGNWKSSGQPEEDPFNPPPGFNKNSFLRNHNREWHVVIESPQLASQFERYIRYDLDQAKEVQSGIAPETEMPDVFVPAEPAAPEVEPEFLPPLRRTRQLRVKPLLSPDNFVEEVTALVTQATNRLYIQNQYLKPTRQTRWRELNEFVADFSRREGVNFRVILRDLDIQDSLEMMAEMNFDLSQVRKLRNTHTKGILVDDLGIVVGSHNWSGQGFMQNRDASLIFDDQDIIDYYERFFLFDWSRALPVELNRPETEPVLAAPGEATPPGMRRVSWSEFENE